MLIIGSAHTQATVLLGLFSLYSKALSHNLHPRSGIILIGKPLQPNNGLSWYGGDLRKPWLYSSGGDVVAQWRGGGG